MYIQVTPLYFYTLLFSCLGMAYALVSEPLAVLELSARRAKPAIEPERCGHLSHIAA